jgi:FRG domain
MWYFRGQADSMWGLEPSLCRCFRQASPSRKKALGIEFGAFRRFQAQIHIFLKDLRVETTEWESVVWWMLMQHYSCPTRLLDWTESPYVGLYFAVQQAPERDGAVWLFPSSRLDTLMSTKYGRMNDIGEPAFLDEGGLKAVYPVVGTKHTDRSVAQQGVFTVCTDPLADHHTPITEAFVEAGESNALAKIVVPANLKCKFLSRLREMNITASSLFPGADGVGRSSAEYIRLRVWRNTRDA